LGKRKHAINFEKLKDRLYLIFTKQGFSIEDSRHAIMSNLRSICMSTAMILNQMSAAEENKIPPALFKTIFGPELKDVKIMFGNVLHNFIGPACLTFFLFRTENYLKVMLSQFDKDVPEGFHDTAVKLFSHISIPKKENKLRVLLVASLIRNSLHTDGVYTKKKKTIKLGSKKFQFVKGESTLTINWTDLYYLAVKIVDVVEEINNSPEIKILKDPIPFKFIPKNS